MKKDEYGLNGITQQDSTIQCSALATAGQNIAALHSASDSVTAE